MTMSEETPSERLNRLSVEGLNTRFGFEGKGFAGYEGRECGEHRTVGPRAWCFDCSEWCSFETPCKGCELPGLRAELEQVKAELDALDGALAGVTNARNRLDRECNVLAIERDALKLIIKRVREDAIEQRRMSGITKGPWKRGAYAQACRTLQILDAALPAPESNEDTEATRWTGIDLSGNLLPETTPDAPTEKIDD
jgi:hypothetical protein